MCEQDLKTELAEAPTAREFLRLAWETSAKNTAARQYIAGVLDALRYEKRLTCQEYGELIDLYFYGIGSEGEAV